MRKALIILLAVFALTAFAACGDSGTVSSDTPSAQSEAVSEPLSEEPSDTSDEPSEIAESSDAPLYDETTAQPEIYGCTRIEDGIFVILGTCEQGAEITAKTPSKTVVTQSDHGYFSARIDSRSTNVKVDITARTEGKNTSETLVYNAVPVSVNKSQWSLIAGLNYQFHLKYTLDDYMRRNTYSSSQLSGLTDKLQKRVERLKTASPDTEIIYMIIPSPATMYPETMPASYEPLDNPSRLEQVTKAITDAGIKVIDLRDTFAAHKNDEYKLYWKTDSHWTDYGAYIAYTELFNYISQKHPECAPRTADDFDWQEDYYIGGDMAMYLEYFNANGYNESNTPMREYNVLRVPSFDMPSQISSIQRYVGGKRLTYNTQTVQNQNNINTDRSDLPSAIVMRDSYSTQIFDILAERFNKTWFHAMWDYTYSVNEIQSRKPDYVIYVLVERNIDSIFN